MNRTEKIRLIVKEVLRRKNLMGISGKIVVVDNSGYTTESQDIKIIHDDFAQTGFTYIFPQVCIAPPDAWSLPFIHNKKETQGESFDRWIKHISPSFRDLAPSLTYMIDDNDIVSCAIEDDILAMELNTTNEDGEIIAEGVAISENEAKMNMEVRSK